MLKQERFINFLLEAEATFPIDKWMFGNENIWPIVRFAIGFKNFGLEATNEPKEKKINKLFYYNSVVVNGIFPLIHNCICCFLFRRKVILTHSFSQYSVPTDIGLFNRFMDSFSLKFSNDRLRFVSLEIARTGFKRGQRYRRTIILDALLWIHAKINKNKPVEFSLDEYEGLLKLATRYDLVTPSYDQVRSIIRSIYVRSLFYEKVLNWFRPVAVLTSVFYSQNSAPLVWACKRKSIPIFDVQHGVINHLHFGYMPWRTDQVRRNQFLPDNVLVWSEIEKKYLSSWSPEKINGIVSGNLWLQVWHKTKRSLLKREKISLEKRLVLYTLQTDIIPKELFSFIRETASHVFWLIRAHPRQMHMVTQFGELLEEQGLRGQFEILLSSQSPLPEVLGVVDLHVTENSTVAIEAFHFGVRTVFTDSLGVEYFRGLIPDESTSFYSGDCDFPDFLKSELSIVSKKATQENIISEAFPLESLLRIR